MKLRKLNRSLWYSLGLALLLVAGSLTAAAGPAFARYRARVKVEIPFAPHYPEKVTLGSMVTEDGGLTYVFRETPNEWKTEGGVTYLEFTAANGTSDKDFRAKDQKIRVRLIASLALMAEGEPAEVTLSVPKTVSADPEDPANAGTSSAQTGATETQYDIYTATAIQIPKGSALHTTFGDGWVYTFYETEDVTKEDGTTETVQTEERTWTLKGGEFSTLNMKLSAENTNTAEEILLRLQVIGE